MHTSHLTTAKIVTRIKTCNIYFHTSYSQATEASGQGVVGFFEKLLNESQEIIKYSGFVLGK